MPTLLVAWARGLAVAMALASLTACKTDLANGGSTGGAPVSERPGHERPIDPPDPLNAAPQINGAPATEILVGQSFVFQPTASDPDGDPLVFSISSKPAWATFNAATGRLWGTPRANDIGTHEEIAIRVSDGANIRGLPQFAIDVVQEDEGNGSATLAWEPPTENTDGSTLTNLDGYKIHYGTASGNYDRTITIDNAGVTRFVIENLDPGTYFFAISAVNESGVESSLSGEASKTI